MFSIGVLAPSLAVGADRVDRTSVFDGRSLDLHSLIRTSGWC